MDDEQAYQELEAAIEKFYAHKREGGAVVTDFILAVKGTGFEGDQRFDGNIFEHKGDVTTGLGIVAYAGAVLEGQLSEMLYAEDDE